MRRLNENVKLMAATEIDLFDARIILDLKHRAFAEQFGEENPLSTSRTQAKEASRN